ncbi:hypothetical protein BDZ85DRAFT_295962 [Elsinoe ampelina]|uniref:Rhodopsin domain-containing protein n=1 Tax=Elsinoe ampelina TaxID=302913 RepID=A0A6A6GDR5_9PEZI|nr:hypothetical protein BDZ85DRAFT_295962 [Elsinoe ampelina]
MTPETFTPEQIANVNRITHTSTILTVVFLVLCTLAASLRGYVKLGIVRLLRIDDALLLVAYVLYAALGGAMLALCVAYRAHAQEEAGAPERVTMTSFGIMLFNIFRAHHKVSSIITAVLCVVPAVLGVVYIGMSWTCGVEHDVTALEIEQCRYTDAAAAVSVTWSSSNALADVGFALLSFYTVWLASLPLRVRVVTGILLSFGSVAAAVSIRRVIAEVTFVTAEIDESRISICLYSTLEAGISITAVCLATMKPLLHRLISFWRDSTSDASEDAPQRYTIGSSERRTKSKTGQGERGYGIQSGRVISESKRGGEPWLMLSTTTTATMTEFPSLADHGKLLV